MNTIFYRNPHTRLGVFSGDRGHTLLVGDVLAANGMGSADCPTVTVTGNVSAKLRARVAALRAREKLPPVRWTDPVLTSGATTVRRAHLAELRAALGGVYAVREQLRPAYPDRTLARRASPAAPLTGQPLPGVCTVLRRRPLAVTGGAVTSS